MKQPELTAQELHFLHLLVSIQAISLGAQILSGESYSQEEATRYGFLETLRSKLSLYAEIPRPTHDPVSV